MLARTDALMSQAETGKIALRPSSPLRPVVARRMPGTNAEGTQKSRPNSYGMVPDEGIEPPTFGLQNRCSTAELIRLPV